MSGHLKRFRQGQGGNVALIFAFAVFALLIAGGVALDYGRLLKARSALQAAADAAALAAGASDKLDAAGVTTVARKYLEANGFDGVVDTIDNVSITKDPATKAINVRVGGKLNTTFMSLAGIPNMDVDAFSQAVGGAGDTPLEVSLVLDTTASMSGSKIDTLKVAAKNLADQVLAGSTSAKVGIVPFASYVNVGVSHRSESWLSVPPDETVPGFCYDTYPNPTGCSTTTNTCYNDGIPYSCEQTSCTGQGDPVPVCVGDYVRKWYGCVGSRPDPFNTRIDQLANTYPGFLDMTCGAPITDLTAAKPDIDSAIDGLTTQGDTFIPGGLIWGWNLLNPAEPFTKAMSSADLAAKNGKKALVLMTDGSNTLYEWPNGIHWSCFPNCDVTDTAMLQICQNIKDDGIILYTVLFDVTDPRIAGLLNTCASDSGKSFVAADGTQLLAAFQQIGRSLGSLRLAR